MIKQKQVNDIVFYLDYHTQVVSECKITSIKNNGNYNLITAFGVKLRNIESWHLYNTREEAEKQSVKDNLIV